MRHSYSAMRSFTLKWVFDKRQKHQHDETQFQHRDSEESAAALPMETIMLSAKRVSAVDRLDGRHGTQEVPAIANASQSQCASTDMPQWLISASQSCRRTIRRTELRQIVPLADTTIYDMERRGAFPQRFNLTSRCVVWDLDEVEAWIEARKQAALTGAAKPASGPDVRLRRKRPVRRASSRP